MCLARVSDILFSSFLGGSEQVRWFTWLFVLFTFNFKFWSVLIQLHQFGKIELGLLEELDLSDDNILEGEDFRALSGDLFTNNISSPIKI